MLMNISNKNKIVEGQISMFGLNQWQNIDLILNMFVTVLLCL